MRKPFTLTMAAVALLAGTAVAQDPPAPAPAQPPAAQTPAQPPGGPAAQALMDAQTRIQDFAQRFQQADPQQAQGMQQEGGQVLDQLGQALQQLQQSPQGQQAQDQITQLQGQVDQVRQQMQQDPAGASQTMQDVAASIGQLAGAAQQAQIPAEADRVIGKTLVSAQGEEVGDVSDVLVTSDGKVQAVLVTQGGALGVGGKQVAVEWGQIQIKGDQLTVNMGADEIGQLPEYQTD